MLARLLRRRAGARRSRWASATTRRCSSPPASERSCGRSTSRSRASTSGATWPRGTTSAGAASWRRRATWRRWARRRGARCRRWSSRDDVDDAALEAIARGQREAADARGAPDRRAATSRAAPALSIATTLLGTCERPVLRSGATRGRRPLDGGARGPRRGGLCARSSGAEAADAASRRRRSPRGGRRGRSSREGRAMAGARHAAVDVSDGLARDVGHLAEASGVRVVLDEDALLGTAALLEAAAALGPTRSTSRSTEARTTRSSPPARGPSKDSAASADVRAGSGVVLRDRQRRALTRAARLRSLRPPAASDAR